MPATLLVRLAAKAGTRLRAGRPSLGCRQCSAAGTRTALDCAPGDRAFLLPEPSELSKRPIKLRCRVFLPRITLGLKLGVTQQTYENMNVVGHHDEVTQQVALAVKVQESVRDDPSQIRVLEHASPVALVEVDHEFAG